LVSYVKGFPHPSSMFPSTAAVPVAPEFDGQNAYQSQHSTKSDCAVIESSPPPLGCGSFTGDPVRRDKSPTGPHVAAGQQSPNDSYDNYTFQTIDAAGYDCSSDGRCSDEEV